MLIAFHEQNTYVKKSVRIDGVTRSDHSTNPLLTTWQVLVELLQAFDSRASGLGHD